MDEDANKNGLGDDVDFYEFDENEDVTSEADKADLDARNKLIGS